MPANSFQPQSIGAHQLNILAGAFDERSVRKNLKEATPGAVIAGRVCHEDSNGKAALGLQLIAVPVSLPLFAWTNASEPNTRRDNLNSAGDVYQGMMPGGSLAFFRHNAPNEFTSTEFEGLAAAPIGSPLTAVNTASTADTDADLNGKLRLRAAVEPIIGYITRAVFTQADGHPVVAFTPAWIPGTYA